MDFAVARARLIEQLSTEITDKQVLAVMSRIPRELFVPQESRQYAYEDRPLPIGWGQTISQPYIIALMTAALELTDEEKVLEVGTGSGYQAAIIAALSRQVITVERIPSLAQKARQVLDDLGYTNIEIHLVKETLGWKKGAPYNAIIVTAGAPSVPADLLAQLAIGGRMVIPVGSRYAQELYKITKRQDKNLVERLCGCRFVSLIGQGAWQEKNAV
jgi:protein-L-isoaspartate(D-aspartate) O-methyltransferase